MTVAVPTITDVVFDFCGVLLDWRTRACLEGRFDDATVDRICADDDPCGFFGYEDRMDAGEDFDSIWPDVVAEQGERVAGIFRYYIAHYDDALPRMLPGMARTPFIFISILATVEVSRFSSVAGLFLLNFMALHSFFSALCMYSSTCFAFSLGSKMRYPSLQLDKYLP